jgi:hypothetical protein
MEQLLKKQEKINNMKKNLFEISEQEKREILEQHNVLKESPKYKIGINFITEQGGMPEESDEPSRQTDDLPTIPGGDGVPVTVAIFQGIESLLGKVVGTVKDGIMYIPDQIMKQYREALAETRYYYRDENGVTSDEFSYDDMGKLISKGIVKKTTQVKRLTWNPNNNRKEPGITKTAFEYPELKEFFWGDESQIEAQKTKQVENDAEKTRQLEILRTYVNKGVLGESGVDFEEVTITTLPGYYIGVKLLEPREGKTVVLLYDNKISIMNPNGSLSSPTTANVVNNNTSGEGSASGQGSSTETSGIIKREGDPYEYKVESDNWLAKRTGTQKWFNITGADFKPAYQKSIDILDTENPKLRTANALKRTV